MAEEGNIITNLNLDAPQQANGEDTAPAVGFIAQYVKDLSVENPNAPDSYQWQDAPEVQVEFNIGSREMGTDVHEVELKMKIVSKAPQGTCFLVELAYCGLIGMRNLSSDQAHAFLYAEGPRMLFPFARRVVADAVRDAGYPPLMLEPIDFNGLYLSQLEAAQAEAA
jgi:preprotein translocase subunit SecB